jgi:hypothetical protein
MAKFKIGVFGSAGSLAKDNNIDRFEKGAQEVGRMIAKNGCIVVTGACPGLPYHAALAAHGWGGEVWGFAGATDRKMLDKTVADCDNNIYSKLFYVPKGAGYLKDISMMRKFRNVTSTAYCDAGIVLSGMWGTMNEFTNLYDMGKVIGVLAGTGGVADELPGLLKKIKKPSKAKIIFSRSPKELVAKVIRELKIRK